MEGRVQSLETELAVLKRDMSSCQKGLAKEIETLKTREQDLPDWIKNAAGAIILAIFAQTISTVWWASELSAKQSTLTVAVAKNTKFIDNWPSMHNEVMIGLTELKTDSRHMKQMLSELKNENLEIKAKQYGHFKDINNIYNEE